MLGVLLAWVKIGNGFTGIWAKDLLTVPLQDCIYFGHFPHYIFYRLKAETRKLTFPDFLVARVLMYDLDFTNQT